MRNTTRTRKESMKMLGLKSLESFRYESPDVTNRVVYHPLEEWLGLKISELSLLTLAP